MADEALVPAYTLRRQTYGIATAGAVYGGPRGVWLECSTCSESQRLVGPKPFDLSDLEVARVFRHHGWRGYGSRMLRARCPQCVARTTSGASDSGTMLAAREGG